MTNPVKFLTAGLCCLLPLAGQAEALPEFDCLIEPWQKVDISFADQGIISRIEVEESQQVKTGQVLASLESGLEQATVKLRQARAGMRQDVEAAQVNLAFSRRNLERLKNLYEKKAIPFHKLDEAETEVAISEQRLQQEKDNQTLARLELGIASEVLKRRTVVSPVDGVVIERYKAVSEYLEDEPVLRLAQLNPLRVHVLIPTSAFGKISEGMLASVVPESPMDTKVRTAKTVIVDPVIDVASGTFAVQLELPNPEYDLPSGLKCSIRFKQE